MDVVFKMNVLMGKFIFVKNISGNFYFDDWVVYLVFAMLFVDKDVS